MTKRVRMIDAYIELGEYVEMSHCAGHKCTTLLIWEASEGGTVHDGAEFWLEDCMCHEEDKQRYCERCRDRAVCEGCYKEKEEE